MIGCYAEIREIFCKHASPPDIGINNNDLTMQEGIAVFLDQFIRGYYGILSDVRILESLIFHVRQFEGLITVEEKLEVLKNEKVLC